jgi:cobalt-zinc-cadmium efflux system outer membrane protein
MSIRHDPSRGLPARLRQVALAALTMACVAAAQGAPLSLDEALSLAGGNLDVSIAGRAAAAAQADVAAADHAPAPQLSAKLSQIDLQNGIGPGNLLADKRIDKGVGVDWTWERGGKRALRTEAARRAAAAAASDLEEVRLQQLLATYGTFFDLLAAQGRQEQLVAIERSAQQTADTAWARMKAGDVAVQDAARAAIEVERARVDLESAQLDLRRIRGALGLLVGRETEAATLEARADWPSGPPPDSTGPVDPLIDIRSDVRAATERVGAAEAALQATQAQRRSDITWGASFDHYPGTSTRQVELRLSMPLAFGYHFEGEIGRAQAQLDAARDALEKARRSARTELLRLQSELAIATVRAQRFERDIVPRSREVAERAELAYAKGALPLTDLLDARRTLRSVLLEAWSTRAGLAKAIGAWQLRSRGAP